jgi:hypothetical protein
MPLLQSLVAIAAGFGSIAALTALTTLLTRWVAPAWSQMPPSRGAQLFNLVASCLFGGVGGAVVAWFAPISPLVHSLILSLVVLPISTLAANELRTSVRGVYPLTLAVLPSMATLGGGILTVLYR